ncbi:uncharacterized protein TNCV_2454011 [Trichonephila clavipes]|nr:uncharacterized protein TNCV_2454011 [Trichonephila clavipes]
MMKHDGALAHFCAFVHDWLEIAYPNRWIKREGTVLWRRRSPDLTPLDFLPLGESQGVAVSRRGQHKTDFVPRAFAVCTSVDTALLRVVHSSIPQRA